jgi:hypothetical protein
MNRKVAGLGDESLAKIAVAVGELKSGNAGR